MPVSDMSSSIGTVYGMPYYLEDKTGSLSGTEYADPYGRMRYSVRCTMKDSMRTAYMIYNLGSGSHKPLASLEFNSDHSLGMVSFTSGVHIPMKQYLTKLSTLGSSKARKFIATDGQEYRWTYRVAPNQEWTCTNANGYLIAYYSLPIPGEPPHVGSSGCMLTLEEAYPHLTVDMLVSLTIMRHITAYNV
ncbi:hypothetical protein PLICRDRAFT_491592 [Plicaturopsis crispa FD-325 SS-3]|nr:hypothetical protein PLICRDRAFT_491592 [Plicaturopsis crispa FD-325 SS-3]